MTSPKPRPAPVAVSPAVEADVLIEDDQWRSLPALEAAIQDAIATLARSGQVALPAESALSIVLTDDAAVATLNANFRQKAGATNVLSFPAGDGAAEPGAAPYLGDVILARETVLREAVDMGLSPLHHVQHLVIHGALHLLGYDHGEAAEADEMERHETALLALLGVPDPYANSEPELVSDSAQAQTSNRKIRS